MAVWVARGTYGNLRATGFLNRRNRFFSSRKARPPWRIFSSRKDAEPQRNCGPLLSAAADWLCSLPRRIAGAFTTLREIFFSSRKDA